MTQIVVDASAVVAALVDVGPEGRWANGSMRGGDLIAPHHMPFEVANVLRRLVKRRAVSAESASQAHADLLTLPVELWPYDVLASRAWELRANATVYDASYLALAEVTGAPLASLDRRLARTTGTTARFLTPDR